MVRLPGSLRTISRGSAQDRDGIYMIVSKILGSKHQFRPTLLRARTRPRLHLEDTSHSQSVGAHDRFSGVFGVGVLWIHLMSTNAFRNCQKASANKGRRQPPGARIVHRIKQLPPPTFY